MPSKRTALVLGATGMVGKELVQKLLKEPAYTAVRLLVRRRLPIEHPRLIQEVVDLENLSMEDYLFTCEALFIAFGTTIAQAGSRAAFRRVDHHIPLEVARKARQAGAETLVLVSAVGADTGSSVFYSRVKGELERDLRNLRYTRLVIFRPSILLGDRQDSRPAERIAMFLGKALDRLRPGLLGPWSGMPAELLAAAMVRTSLDAEPGVEILFYPQTRALVASNPRDDV